LGFPSILVQKAIKFLTKPSAIIANLLAVSTPLEAAIEYLVLHVPECDLPQRFLPTKNSSNSFVTSLHSGSDDLKRRWIEEKATKEAGYPANVVKECMNDTGSSDGGASLIASLGKRLLGDDDEFSESLPGSASPYDIEPTELEAYGAKFVTKSELVMPLFSAPIQVHIFVSADSHPAYPRPDFIPVYLSSETVPAYVRLHLLSRLLHGAKLDTFIESGEGFCLAVMRLLEDEWEKMESESRPDISLVLQHLLPRHENVAVNNAPEPDILSELGGISRKRRTKLIDERTSTQIRDEFLSLRQKEEVGDLQ
jgi:ATP-dependent RNA helicase DHX57